jgi:hypothetical protein
MRSATNNEQSRDDENGKGGRVRQHIKTPAAIRSQGSIEPVHLDQPEGSESEFNVCGTTPDGGHNGKDDIALDVAGIFHAVVESYGNGGCVDKDEECKNEESPALPTMMPSKWKLG